MLLLMISFSDHTSYARRIRLQSIVSASEIFRRQNRYDEAIKILDKAEVNNLNGYWRIAVLGAYGETLASHPQGKKAEAAGKLKEALAVKGITDAQKVAYEKRLAELQAEDK